jgi:DNA polymerase III delta subunit
MKFIDLKGRLKEGRPQRLYCVYGSDAALVLRGTKMLYDCVSEPDWNITRISAGDIMKKLRAVPMLADFRLLHICDYTDKPPEDFIAYLKSPAEGDAETVVLVTGEGKLLEACKGLGEDVDCNPMDAATLRRWADIRLRPHGITDEGMDALLSATGNAMTRLEGEVQKLAAYAAGRRVTAEDVRLLVHADADGKLYEFTESLAGRQTDRALASLELLRQDMQSMQILTGIYGHFRRLLFTAVYRGAPDELPKLLGVKPGALVYIRRQAALYTPRKLKSICDMLHACDAAVKSGKSTDAQTLQYAAMRILLS